MGRGPEARRNGRASVWRRAAEPLRLPLRIAIFPWIVSRVVVLIALAIARELSARAALGSAIAGRVHQGLLGWDAGWYESIASHGYWGAGHQSLRFFPLVPILTRVISVLPGVSVGAALLVVSNLSALAAVAALAGLALGETADGGIARRAAWFA
ncbi:MAG TPA: hypothetical protein VEJ87_06065, partial [Acidimicrobiales bacterium]|nr:hypothetical protein [Acidimicrobiales bacterium]